MQDLVEGCLVLGVVQEVCDVKLIVSLPHAVSGVIDITSISHAYTCVVEKIVANEIQEEAEVRHFLFN